MPSFLAGGLLTRLRPAADAGSDADLLGRFVGSRDAEAFAEIVRRHGGMVLAVCRRALGDGPDAEDAHQVAFMALARDAARISTPNALAGWLHRVAHLTARKLAGRVHRRKPEPLLTDPATPMPPPPENDLKAVIDEELLALPERFRAVAVMCLVEGRTNTEAAALLGIPKGTVDSRLSTAKGKLPERLLRKGIAAAALFTLETVLLSDTQASAGRAAALAKDVIGIALDYAAGVPAAGTEHLIHTANGVRPMTNPMKWLAVVAFSTALIGGGGVGVYVATAGDKPTPTADAKADPKKPPETKPDEKPKEKPTDAKPGEVKTADDVQKALKSEVSISDKARTLGEVFEQIEKDHGLNIRLDTAAFRRRGWGEGVPDYENLQEGIFNKKIRTNGLNRVPVEEALRELLAQVGSGGGERLNLLSYRIKGNTILIAPEYQPATIPGSGQNGEPAQQMVTPGQLLEDMYGVSVTVRYKKKPLAEVIEDLQERTGANIVVNLTGHPEPEKVLITANFNDARLLTVLKIIGDMANLKPAVVDNVFYLTDPAKAHQFETELHRDLFGKPAEPKGK